MQYVAFLRGMNLGGRRISNPELCAAFEHIGFTAVQAFLASGNVIFEAQDGPDAVRARLEAGLLDQLGYAVPSVIRTAAEVNAIAAHAPFAADADAKRGKPQVIFIQDTPAPKVMALHTDADWLEIGAGVIYWWPIAGLNETRFDIKGLERITGTTTVRTKNMVDRLARKFL